MDATVTDRGDEVDSPEDPVIDAAIQLAHHAMAQGLAIAWKDKKSAAESYRGFLLAFGRLHRLRQRERQQTPGIADPGE